jgi:hypothetical protein
LDPITVHFQNLLVLTRWGEELPNDPIYIAFLREADRGLVFEAKMA